MNKKYLTLISGVAFTAAVFTAKAQNVAINPTGAVPFNASVLLDLSNNLTNGTQGFLAPYAALTASNVAAPLVAPPAGLIVYNTATAGASPNNVVPGYYYWDGAKWQLFLTQGGINGFAWTILGNSATTPSVAAIGAPITAGSNFVGTTDNKDLVFALNNGANTLERMRIQASTGNVGISNIAPTTLFQVGNGGATGKLSINSQDNFNGQFQIGNPTVNSEASINFISGVTAFGGAAASASGNNFMWNMGAGNYGNGGNTFSIANVGLGKPVITLLANGNVGIGNVAPSQNLSVQNGENIDMAGTNNGFLNNGFNTGNGLSFGIASGEGLASKRTAGGNQFGLDFYTNFTNRMSIANNGFVGIGTNAPVGLLHINGVDWSFNNPVIIQSTNGALVGPDIRFKNAGGGHIWDIIASTGTGAGIGVSAFGIYDNTAGFYRFDIQPNGYVGIGVNPAQQLEVGNNAGTVRIDGIKAGNTFYSAATPTTAASSIMFTNNTTGDVQALAPSATNGQVLTQTAGGPAWQTPTVGTVTSVTGTAPIVVAPATPNPVVSLQGAAGTVCYGTGGGSNFNAAGTTGQYLQSAGGGAPIWINMDTYAEAYIVNGQTGGNAGVYTAGAGYGIVVSVTTPAAGTYIIVAQCETGGSCTAGPYVELTDGVAVQDVQQDYEAYNYVNPYGWYPNSWLKEETVPAGTVFSIKANQNACFNASYVRNAHIGLIRVH